MNPRGLLLMGLVLVLLVSGRAYAERPLQLRDDRIVFAPWAARPTDVVDPALGRIDVRECRALRAGLEVRGDIGSQSGSVLVLVMNGDPTLVGVAVGAGYARQAGLVPDARTGEFLVVLPWASTSAEFAIASADSISHEDSSIRRGVGSFCP